MSGQADVERIEPWQLAAYLRRLQTRGSQEVTWNKQRLTLEQALERAGGLSDTATVVVDGDTVYVAEPDHSADEAPRTGPVPIQVFPTRRR
jgi:hypothetical protein